MKNIDYEDFGNRVRLQRRKAHITQAALAKKLGISTSFLGHLERGTRIPSLETLCLLCNVFKVMPRYFLASGLEDGLSFTDLEKAEEEYRKRMCELLRETTAVLDKWDELRRQRIRAEQEAGELYDFEPTEYEITEDDEDEE